MGPGRSSLRYSVDLAGLHATCESNYARLMQLYPDYEVTNQREFELVTGERIRIDIVERCRYTTLMHVCQQGGDHWLIAPRFDLRAYHDARMVEVTGFQSGRRVEARYEYPNPDMYARDEKAQQNLFLAEWLAHCLEQGQVALEFSSTAPGTANAS